MEYQHIPTEADCSEQQSRLEMVRKQMIDDQTLTTNQLLTEMSNIEDIEGDEEENIE
jgi:hypothetical protein